MFEDGRPIYLQIAERIRDDVLSGALQAGDQVMSTTQYATFYGINPATAAKAFQELLADGVIYKRRGVGMFVSDDAAATLRDAARQDFYRGVLDPALDRAAVLGIPPEDLVAHLEQHLAARGGASGRLDDTDRPGATT